MSKLTIAVDLAKDVFEIAVAKPSGKIIERKRVTRSQFDRFWQTREPCAVVMEACGSAHHWARLLVGLGFDVRLLPAQYVKPYRPRNKTDRADCEALLEAARSAHIKAVGIKSQDPQAILALHRGREQWKDTRTMRINGMRGLLREFGIIAPAGAETFLSRLPQLLERHRERPLRAAQAHQNKGRALTHPQQWAVQKADELRHSNQAAVALANRLARIAWAVWRHERRFDGNYRSPAPAA